MRVLVTGASGFVGSHILNKLTVSEVIAPRGKNRPLDLLLPVSVNKIMAHKPDVILHLACGGDEELMAMHVAQAATQLKCRVVFTSTDIVHGGRGPYDDETSPAPLNDYGLRKAKAEAMIRSTVRYLIVRVPLVVDWRDAARPLEWQRLLRCEKCNLFVNELRNAIDVEELTKVLAELVCRPELYGYLNVGGEAISRYALGVRFCRERDLNESLCAPTVSDEPRDFRLDLAKFHNVLRRDLYVS